MITSREELRRQANNDRLDAVKEFSEKRNPYFMGK
jgi:hypothetical protein